MNISDIQSGEMICSCREIAIEQVEEKGSL